MTKKYMIVKTLVEIETSYEGSQFSNVAVGDGEVNLGEISLKDAEVLLSKYTLVPPPEAAFIAKVNKRLSRALHSS